MIVVALTGCETAKEHFDKGQEYSMHKQYDEAISEYTSAIKMDGQYTEAYWERGITYCDIHEYDKSINDVYMVLYLNPNDAWAYYLRGSDYEFKDEYDKAIDDFNTAIELNPNEILAYLARGGTYYLKGEYNAAITDFTKGIELETDMPSSDSARWLHDFYTERGFAYKANGDIDKAESDSNKAQELETESKTNPTPSPDEITPIPTPAPISSPGYSRNMPVGIGSPLDIEINSRGSAGNDYKVRITLLQIIRGSAAWQLIMPAYHLNHPPKVGFEYILAKIRVDYLNGLDPDTTLNISSVSFDVISEKGEEYSIYDQDMVIGPKPFIDTSLYPGASHEGWIVFLVAQDDAKPLMTFGRSYDGTGGIWFKLY
ncbi:MAG: tetratricopeptide repeat protein [Dehalococcoidia bacterium]